MVFHEIPHPCRERYFMIFDGTSWHPNIASDFTVLHDIRMSLRKSERSESHCDLLPPCFWGSCLRGPANWYQSNSLWTLCIFHSFFKICVSFVFAFLNDLHQFLQCSSTAAVRQGSSFGHGFGHGFSSKVSVSSRRELNFGIQLLGATHFGPS